MSSKLFFKKMFFTVFIFNLIFSFTSAVPVQKGYVLVPIRDIEKSGARQGIIAGWIQNSQFFPLEINVSDVITQVESGVVNTGQNIVAVAQILGQSAGNKFHDWIYNLGQRYPIINRIPIVGSPNDQTQNPQKVFAYGPPKEDQVDSIPDPSELYTYP